MATPGNVVGTLKVSEYCRTFSHGSFAIVFTVSRVFQTELSRTLLTVIIVFKNIAAATTMRPSFERAASGRLYQRRVTAGAIILVLE
jgi:hypothetical protein